jgi:hypothetical protein
MSTIVTIDFEKDDSYLSTPLPVPNYPKEPIYPDWPSAWKGLESILPAIIKKFDVKQNFALEFGVEFGYSTAAFAQLFDNVTGIDTFLGDPHSDLQLGGGKTRPRTDFFEYTRKNLEKWPNIHIFQMDYKEWITKDTSQYDLIHVDIVHTFEDTLACGRWAADHAPVVVFHDTESFPEVKRAVAAIAEDTGKTFYNYPHCYGLGIVA